MRFDPTFEFDDFALTLSRIFLNHRLFYTPNSYEYRISREFLHLLRQAFILNGFQIKEDNIIIYLFSDANDITENAVVDGSKTPFRRIYSDRDELDHPLYYTGGLPMNIIVNDVHS